MTMDEQLIRAMGEKLKEVHVEYVQALDGLRLANGYVTEISDRVHSLSKLRTGLQDSIQEMGGPRIDAPPVEVDKPRPSK